MTPKFQCRGCNVPNNKVCKRSEICGQCTRECEHEIKKIVESTETSEVKVFNE